MRARAAVLREFGAPLEITEIEVEGPRAGEVLVAVSASGICGSDLKAIDGKSPIVREVPYILGHESSGVVAAVGAGVTRVQPGDHVVIGMNRPCGRCRNCVHCRVHLCTDPARLKSIMGLTEDGSTRLKYRGASIRPMLGIGSFAEYEVVDESACIRVSKDVPLEVLALTACGVVTGIGAVLNTAQVERGSSVLVVGAGGVGLNAVQGAVLAGATTIVVVDLVEYKRDAALRFGATHVLDPEDLPAQVDTIVPGGVDYAFDATGNPDVLAAAFASTRPGGTTVMVGSPPQDKPLSIPADLLFASRRLMGSQGGDAAPARDLPLLVDLYAKGRLDLDNLVTERRPLEEINDAIENVRAGTVTRALVVFDGSSESRV